MLANVYQRLSVTALALFSTAIAGCVSGLASSPLIVKKLQIVSAGHTGCVPEENEITKVDASLDGSGTWYATCKGKTYLCSAVGTTGGSESFSCAPVAQ
jgi:hypothetical protein